MTRRDPRHARLWLRTVIAALTLTALPDAGFAADRTPAAAPVPLRDADLGRRGSDRARPAALRDVAHTIDAHINPLSHRPHPRIDRRASA